MQGVRHIAILGGGLAGLSLAVQLARRRVDMTISIVEPREHYRDDRTWCFWDVIDHPFRHLVTHRWYAWRVASGNGEAIGRSERYPYCRLPAGDFYDEACRLLARSPGVRLVRGVRVTGVQERGEGLGIETDAGPLTADLAFDARPPAAGIDPAGREPFFWQAFEGWRIRTDRPCFDPARVELMDFSVRPCGPDIRFLYVLPLGPREAMVESTLFAPGAGRPPVGHDGHLREALHRRIGDGAWHVEASERGAIPMTTARPPVAECPRLIAIGTRAGAPRPSSGYAFLPIQRHSARLAERVARGRTPHVDMRSRTTLWLDRVFLRYLERNPATAAGLYHQLFERVPGDRLVRFLSETGTPIDHLAVMAALPTGPFLRQALAPALGRASALDS